MNNHRTANGENNEGILIKTVALRCLFLAPCWSLPWSHPIATATKQHINILFTIKTKSSYQLECFDESLNKMTLLDFTLTRIDFNENFSYKSLFKNRIHTTVSNYYSILKWTIKNCLKKSTWAMNLTVLWNMYRYYEWGTQGLGHVTPLLFKFTDPKLSSHNSWEYLWYIRLRNCIFITVRLWEAGEW